MVYDYGKKDGSRIDDHLVFTMSKQLSTCMRWDVQELLRIGNLEGWSNISRMLASEYFEGSGLTVGDVLRMVNHQNGKPGVAKGARYRTRFLDGEWEIMVVKGQSKRVFGGLRHREFLC